MTEDFEFGILNSGWGRQRDWKVEFGIKCGGHGALRIALKIVDKFLVSGIGVPRCRFASDGIFDRFQRIAK